MSAISADGTRGSNEFCWVNVLTPNPSGAREFLSAVLGWKFAEIPGVGHRIRVGARDARDIGGLFDTVSPRTPNGTAPIVGVLLKVESVDSLAERVRRLGGRSSAPFDVGTAGRMSVCHDPLGAEFDVWQPGTLAGTDVDASLHGAPCWFELMSVDAERALKFYGELLGWTAVDVSSNDFEYRTLCIGARPVAGLLAITPRMGAMSSRWRTYFSVDDAERAASLAVELGGKLSMTMKKVPGGKFCEITSPQGLVFCVSERTP